MLVNLSSLSVFLQHSSEHTHAAHPHHGDRHTRVGSTLSLTRTSVSALSLGFGVGSDTGARVHLDGSLGDVRIFDQLAHSVAFLSQRQSPVSLHYIKKDSIRELASLIRDSTVGSRRSRRLPHLRMSAAKRFCNAQGGLSNHIVSNPSF